MPSEISDERLLRAINDFDPNENPAFSSAKRILGSDFIAPKKPRGFTNRQIKGLLDKLPDRSTLEWCLHNGYLLVPGNPRQELIVGVVAGILVDPNAQGSCLMFERNGKKKPDYVPSWYLINKSPYAGAPSQSAGSPPAALAGGPVLLSVSEVLWVWDLYIAQQNAPTDNSVVYEDIGASNDTFARTIFDDCRRGKFIPVGWRL